MLDGLIILPGARECIRSLHANGTPQAILTNKHGPTARTVSAHCGFDQSISVCIGNTDTQWHKPEAALTRHVLAQLDCDTDRVAYIGDSPTDVATARNAGLISLGVSTGAHAIDELLEAGATAAYPSLTELQQHWLSGCSRR